MTTTRRTDLVGGSAALLEKYSAIWQLIYAGADGIANPADWEQLGGPNGDYVTGDDVVWAQRDIPKVVAMLRMAPIGITGCYQRRESAV
jgi:hypothetical protein